MCYTVQPTQPPHFYHQRYQRIHPQTHLPTSSRQQQKEVKPVHDLISSNQSQLKQPQAPRSAFMCFKDHKNQKARTENDDQILESKAQAWKKLSDKERGYWEEAAREDKLRFVREKAAYKGQWKIPKRRAKKPPGAPKVCPTGGYHRYKEGW